MIHQPRFAALLATVTLMVAGCADRPGAAFSASAESRRTDKVSLVSITDVRERIAQHQGKVLVVHLWALW